MTGTEDEANIALERLKHLLHLAEQAKNGNDFILYLQEAMSTAEALIHDMEIGEVR